MPEILIDIITFFLFCFAASTILFFRKGPPPLPIKENKRFYISFILKMYVAALTIAVSLSFLGGKPLHSIFNEESATYFTVVVEVLVVISIGILFMAFSFLLLNLKSNQKRK